MKMMNWINALAIGGMIMTAAIGASEASNRCDRAHYEIVSAVSEYTHHSHIHLDVACPVKRDRHGNPIFYRAISCQFDITGDDDPHHNNQSFVAINDASLIRFNSHHGGRHLEGRYGCHFRANNFKAYFPGDHHDFDWRMRGSATCVPASCVESYETDHYRDEGRDALWFPDWDAWSH